MSSTSNNMHSFEREMYELTLENSNIFQKDRPSEDELKEIYAASILGRKADSYLHVKRGQGPEQGGIGALPSSAGHEIAQSAPMQALNQDDWAFPYYRDNVMQIAKNASDGTEDADYSLFESLTTDELDESVNLAVNDIMQHYVGIGNCADTNRESNVFPPSIVVGGHLPIAHGAAMAADLKGDEKTMLASFGDGASSEGDFHEAMNFAGVFNSPTVFYCQNNDWAISTPGNRQTASDTIAQKADAYGFESIKVNGDNPLTGFAGTNAAVRKARKGDGPTLIEAATTRLGDHTYNDDATRYRDEQPDDPLEEFEEYMKDMFISEDEDQQLKQTAEAVVRTAYSEAVQQRTEARKQPGFFENVFDEMSDELREQMKEAGKYGEPENWEL
jgi:pyruvate dehydrogenase E1 component alpha subunit